MRLPVFPNWFPFNDMLLDGHLQVGDFGVKTRSYDWKYRGPVLLYNSGRTAYHCVQAYKYVNGPEHHGFIVGACQLVDVRPLTEKEHLKMQCNFNNLTVRQVKTEPWKVLVGPYPFGYFFTDIKRLREPVAFSWPAGPVKPIFRDICSGSALQRQLRLVGVCA